MFIEDVHFKRGESTPQPLHSEPVWFAKIVTLPHIGKFGEGPPDWAHIRIFLAIYSV